MGNDKKVLKIGGSLIFDDDVAVKKEKVSDFIELIKKSKNKVDCVVVGGGKVARIYINAYRDLKDNQAIQDELGIKVSRLNALLLASLVGADIAYQGVPESIEELVKVKSMVPDKIVFLGGMEIGQSTTSVACQAAESLEAGALVIGTDVDGIYTADPDKDPGAKKLDEVTLEEVAKILKLSSAGNQAAGEYRIFDNVSLGIITRSNIPIRIVLGDIPTLESALSGKKVGTLIKS